MEQLTTEVVHKIPIKSLCRPDRNKFCDKCRRTNCASVNSGRKCYPQECSREPVNKEIVFEPFIDYIQ